MGQEDYSGRIKSADSLRNIRSINGTLGDNDTLTGGAGKAILIGGRGDDTLTGGGSEDVIIGDNGEAVYVAGATVRNASTLGVTGTAGAYVLTDGQSRAALRWDATAAEIQAALEGFTDIGAFHALVSGTPGSWQLSLENPDGNRPVSVAADAQAVVNANMISVGGTSGRYAITDGTSSAVLAWNADAATIQAALGRFSSVGGSANVTVVAGATAGTWKLNFQNIATNPALRIVPSADVAKADVTLSAGTLLTVRGSDGVYVLTDGTDSTTLDWNASGAQIRAALEGFASVGAGNASVTGTVGNWVLARQDGTTISNLSLVASSEITSARAGVASRVLTIGNTAGSYTITDGFEIAALAGNADANAIKAALEKFTHIGAGNATVSSGTFAGSWQIGLLNATPPALSIVAAATASVTPVTATTLTVASIAGSYTLTDGTKSATLSYAATASGIQNALVAAGFAGSPAVSLTAPGVFSVAYTGTAPVLSAQGATGVKTVVRSNDLADQFNGAVKLGNDTINAGAGDNTVIGGVGVDNITALVGNDTIMGDNGQFNFAPLTAIIDSVATTELGLGDVDHIDAGQGQNILLGGFGKDTLTAGDGNNVVMGDNGLIDYNAAGKLIGISTTDVLAATGDIDTVTMGNGNNTILGGVGGDRITTGTGTDTIMGDNGAVVMDATGTKFVQIASNVYLTGSTTVLDLTGGNDQITTGEGTKIVVGGFGTDTIYAGADPLTGLPVGATSNHIILGDNGQVDYNAAGLVVSYQTTDTVAATGAADTIVTGNGNNTILGGVGGDTVTTA
ncbi:MAG TPA: calcium-binding protein, partial [Vicinamibacterales bacterium]|nr:calcium-binding protein [Vicinamibacterales bacterium]